MDGVVGNKGFGGRHADHPGNPFERHPELKQDAPAGVGAVRRQLPVGVPGLADVSEGVGVAGDLQLLGHFDNHLGDQFEDSPGMRVHLGAALGKHGQAFLVDDLDAQPFGGVLDEQAVGEPLEVGDALDGFAQLCLGLFELFFLLSFRQFPGLGFRRLLVLTGAGAVLGGFLNGLFAARVARLRRRKIDVDAGPGGNVFHSPFLEDGLAAEDVSGAAGIPGKGNRGEVIGDALQLILGHRVEQPQEQEERHHRRHEVGIGHLPGAAVMAVPAFLALLDDDRLTLVRHGSDLSCGGQFLHHLLHFAEGGPDV